MKISYIIINILLFTLLFVNYSNCQSIIGRVSDKQGNPLPHATIYVSGTTGGAVAGAEGSYSLNVPPGKYTIIAKYVGYQSQSQSITTSNKPVTLNFQLAEEELALSDVIITPDGKDPAYTIIAKAVEKKSYFKSLLNNYTYNAYTKTNIQLLKKPDIKLIKTPKEDKADTNAKVLYFSENISEVAIQEPDKIKETVTASRVSGDSKSYSLFASLFLRFTLNTNIVQIDGLSERGFISPLSNSTFSFYDFKLLGSTRDGNHTLHKIKVIPKRKNDPVFAGIVWIVDSTYAVQGFDLNLTRARQLETIDSIHITQTYLPTHTDAWVPASVRFDFLGSVLGAKFGGYSGSAFKDYNLNPTFNTKIFDNELLKVVPDATKKDSTFWIDNRPLVLTDYEQKDLRKKDSLEIVRNSPTYLDSLTRVRGKFKVGALFSGYTRKNYRTKNEFEISAPLTWVNFNTMEGWNIAPTVTKRWVFAEEKKRISASITPRYGFANEKFSYKAIVTYQFQGTRGRFSTTRNFITLEGGDYPQYFGINEQISPIWNTAYTLFAELNYLKMYQKQFLKVSAGKELLNGLIARASLNYEHRTALGNRTAQSWVATERVYSPNIGIPISDVFIAEVRFTYLIANKYVTTPDGKLNFGSKYPAINLYYRRGIPVVSGANFDFLRLTLEDDFKLGLLGTLQWLIGGGGFLSKSTLGFADYYHPWANQTFYKSTERLNQFGIQNYYAYSTRRPFIEGYAEHHFNGFIFNKLPLIKKLGLQEIVGARYFYTESEDHYLELDFGIENIGKKWLKVINGLRVDFYYRIKGESFTNMGVTIGISQ